MAKINWQKGLFRIYMLLSGGWFIFAVVVILSGGKIKTFEQLLLIIFIPALPWIIHYFVKWTVKWIIQGFKGEQNL